MESAMPSEVKMPQLGETVVEGTITRWLKGEGERVEMDEPLVEVSTDKVDSEIPSPAAGTVARIYVPEGETVTVGTLIAEIAAGEEAGRPLAGTGAGADGADGARAQPPPPPAYEKVRPIEIPQPDRAPAAVASFPDAPAGEKEAAAARLEPTDVEPRRGVLSPLVRRLAADHGVDLATVKGTGTGGRITKQDVLRATESRPPAASPKSPEPPQRPAPPAQPAAEMAAAPEAAEVVDTPGAGDEVVAITHMRKAIAEHMVSSHLETARAWNVVEVDMSRIWRLRQLAGPSFSEREGFSLTWMPFVAKAVTQALLTYPQVNSSWNGDGTTTLKHYVNLGIAVALDRGLIVPVIHRADGMNLVGLSRAVRDLAQRARQKKLVPDDVASGTFTITNPGPFGSILSVPIINRGQTGILAFDGVTKRPVVVTDEDGNDSIAIRHMVFISMSWDHRVIDGAEAARFLALIKALLEKAEFSPDLSAYLPQG